MCKGFDRKMRQRIKKQIAIINQSFWQVYYDIDLPIGMFLRYKSKKELEDYIIAMHKIYEEINDPAKAIKLYI
ncbi:MAG: hypothetical protein ABSA84_04375 [Gammaproteobacteria bacterium]